MSLLGGTITINTGTGTWTGTGLANAFMLAKEAGWNAAVAALGSAPAPSVAQKVAVYQGFKAEAEAFGAALATYLAGNAVVTTVVGAGALGGGIPGAPVNLGGTIT